MFRKKDIYELLNQAIVKERNIAEEARIREDKALYENEELREQLDRLIAENKRLKKENKKLFDYLDKTAILIAEKVKGNK